MRRNLLIGVAIGAGLSSAVYVAAGQFKSASPKLSPKMRVYELGYQRPRSPLPNDFKGIPDPLTATLPSQALAELAASCRVPQYKLEALDKGGYDRNPSASLYMDPAKVSDETFNCLGERVRPPYLTLHVFERCRSLMEKSRDNPPCQEPIP
jgi:hypothetical protein